MKFGQFLGISAANWASSGCACGIFIAHRLILWAVNIPGQVQLIGSLDGCGGGPCGELLSPQCCLAELTQPVATSRCHSYSDVQS